MSVYKQRRAKLKLQQSRAEYAKSILEKAIDIPLKSDQRALAEQALNEWKNRIPIHQGRNLSDRWRKY